MQSISDENAIAARRALVEAGGLVPGWTKSRVLREACAKGLDLIEAAIRDADLPRRTLASMPGLRAPHNVG